MTDNSLPTPGEKAKILLLTGFLGSGKTTLLKRILSWQDDLSGTVVLVNELGEVGIDGGLLQGDGSDVVELTSGCVCCTIKADLTRTLREIWKRFRPKRILLEATGVAEPDAVAAVLEDRELSRWMTLQKIITVLDVRFWKGRDKFGTFFVNQAQQADLILLNKVDLLEEGQVSEHLREMHQLMPGCHVIPTIYCKVDPETLWSDDHKRTSGFKILQFYPPLQAESLDHEQDHAHHLHHHHEEDITHTRDARGFVAFEFSVKEPLDEVRFGRFLEEVPWEVFRIKGAVRFPDRTSLLNFVAGRSDWDVWEGPDETQLVFVGWNVNPEDLLQEVKACVQRESD